ncbi:hypothetical protein Tco_1528097, partial [Tanacetum coccineum]
VGEPKDDVVQKHSSQVRESKDDIVQKHNSQVRELKDDVPDPSEMKKIAAEGILTCLQDAIDSLNKGECPRSHFKKGRKTSNDTVT